MSIANSLKVTAVLVAASLLQSCASAPAQQNSGPMAGDFSDDSLEVLFATEFPVATKEEAVAKAAMAYRDGEYDKAQFYLVRALKFDVTDVKILVQIGNLHVMQGNAVLAARAFGFALQQEPAHALALEGLGLLHFRAGNDARARELLESAVAANPDLWRSHNALGVIADRERNFGAAMAYYDRALEIQPMSDSILINRGYSKFLQEDYHAASLDFFEAAKRSNNPRAWRNLGMVYAHQSWYDAALEAYVEVMDKPDAHNEIGAIAMKIGDSEAADYHLNEAIRLSPTYFAHAEENLAELRRSRGSQSLN